MSELKPPQNLEAEQSVLGAMMIEQSALLDGVKLLTARDFYRPVHQAIFQALHTLYRKGEVIDLITVQEELRKRGILEKCGGTEYLMALIESVTSAANLTSHAAIVDRKAFARKVIAGADEVKAAAYRDDDDLSSKVMNFALSVTERNSADIKPANNLVHAVADRFADAQNGVVQHGIPFRLTKLDSLTGGAKNGNYVVIGGRPSEGKTVLACELIEQCCRCGYPAVLFSQEMCGESIVQRMAGSIARVSIYDVMHNQVKRDSDAWVKLTDALGEISQWDFSINDVDITIDQLVAAAEHWALSRTAMPHRLIAVDYLQLLKSDGKQQSRNLEIGEWSRKFKQLANRTKSVVVVLSQLSRAPTKREDKHPQLADLRESGNIEQDADIVILLYNPPNNDPTGHRIANINVAKQREGPTGTFDCVFDGTCTRFENKADESYGEPVEPATRTFENAWWHS